MKILALGATLLVASLATSDTPLVQVRELPNGSTISIVAWNAGDATVGLRTRLRRDGSLLGEDRADEHRLYVSSSLVEAHGGFAFRDSTERQGEPFPRPRTRGSSAQGQFTLRATNYDGKLLRNAGNATDEDACRFGNVCSPKATIGLGLPDEWLRQHRDSIVVTMHARDGQNWTVRLDRPVIQAYLATIDSVSAALKAAVKKQ